MKYTTTSCKKCGFKTRNRESSLPSVQIGLPIIECPNCHNFILDSIITEYEFMSKSEKGRFEKNNAMLLSIPGNLIYIIMGLFFLIWGLSTTGDYSIIAPIIGLILIMMGMAQIVKNIKIYINGNLEQEIYMSLKRTENKEYREFLERIYKSFGICRTYEPYLGKEKFLEDNKHFEQSDRYKINMEYFNSVWSDKVRREEMELNNVYEFFHH